ncbi:MAG: endonuclease MutS2, partial [Bacteroidales bacterium]
PDNFEEKTDFDQIRKMINDACISSLGRGFAEKMRFSDNYSMIQRLLDQTEEFRQIILTGKNYPASNYYDPFRVLERIKLAGTFAEPD